MTQVAEELTTSRELRERYAGRTEVLDKVKALSMLPGDMWVTADMTATYFEVDSPTIRKLIQRNREELDADGLKVLRGKDARDIASLANMSSKATMVTVLPRRAVLRMAMLLRDSSIARGVRSYLLDVEERKRPEPTPEREFTEIEVARRWVAALERAEVLEQLAAAQAQQIERARPKVEYVDAFVSASDDLTTIKAFGQQIGWTERDLRRYLVEHKVIYRREVFRTSESTGAPVREWQWLANARYVAWFAVRDQPAAPRLHNGQLMTTLYVNAVGKRAVRELLQRKPDPGLALDDGSDENSAGAE